MSYQERRAIVSLISTILITVFYTAYMIQRYPDADPYSPEILRFWGAYFLILIPVTIVAKILIYIVFIIINTIATGEEEASVSITDERDKLIELKANNISNYVFVAGFMLGMGSLVINLPPSVLFSILICSGIASEIVSEISQFYFYRRGV